MNFIRRHPSLRALSAKLHVLAAWTDHFLSHPFRITWNFIKAVARWVWLALVNSARYLWSAIKLHRVGLFRAGLVVASLVVLMIMLYSGVAMYFEAQMTPVPTPDNFVYLGQNWGAAATADDRTDFYYTAQGAFVKDLRYDWLVYLERPWKQDRFASPQYMRSYGFIVDPADSPKNPGGLPVGFAARYAVKDNEMMLDMTCAACHTGELLVVKDGKRTSVRIDGGSAHNDLTSMKPGRFAGDLAISLLNTGVNPFKFRRFAANVLKQRNNSANKTALWMNLWAAILTSGKQAFTEWRLGVYPMEEGYGRTDGLGRIDNTAFAVNITPKNYKVANAPVSYPAIWEMPLLDWVQYTASVRQPMARNIGEAMGTGARYYLKDPFGNALPTSERFDASTKVANLSKIEDLMRKLTPPCWPEDVFGKIDVVKAAAGKKLFNGPKFHCVGCHGPHPAPDFVTASEAPYKLVARSPVPLKDNANVPHWTATTLAVQDIGTDPTSAVNFVRERVDLSETGMKAVEVEKELTFYYQEEYCRRVEYNQNLVTDLAALPQPPGAAPLPPNPPLSPSDQDDRRDYAMRACAAAGYPVPKYSASRCPKPGTPIVLKPDPSDIDNIAPTSLGSGPPTLQSACSDLSHLVTEDMDGFLKENIDPIDITSVGMGDGLNYLITLVRKRAYQDMGIDSPDRAVEQGLNDGYAQLDIPNPAAQYMARPLAGMWATPPFLHNGSVPSLYELLLPAYGRTKRFYIKTPLFDPHAVGFYTNAPEKGAFLYDTGLQGNHNTGHEFRAGHLPYKAGNPPDYGVIGPEMNDEERWDIIEYLKILRDRPNDPVCPEEKYLTDAKKSPEPKKYAEVKTTEVKR